MKTFAFYFFLSSPLMALIAAPSVSVVPAFIHVHWAHRQGKRLQIRLNKCGVNGNNNNNTTVRAVILRKLCFIKNLCADRCTVLRETSLFFPSSRQPPFSNGVAYLLTVNSPSPFSIQVFPRILVHPGFVNEWKKSGEQIHGRIHAMCAKHAFIHPRNGSPYVTLINYGQDKIEKMETFCQRF